MSGWDIRFPSSRGCQIGQVQFEAIPERVAAGVFDLGGPGGREAEARGVSGEGADRDAGDGEAAGPAGNDREACACGDEVQNRVFLAGDQVQAGGKACGLEEPEGEVVAMRAAGAIWHDHRHIGQILHGNLGFRGQGVGFGKGDHGGFLGNRMDDEAAIKVGGRAEDGEVERAAEEPRDEADGFLFDNLDCDLGVAFAEQLQEGRNEASGGAVDHPDPERQLQRGGEGLGFGAEKLKLAQGFSGRGEERVACGGEADVACGAGEERKAEVLLQRLDVTAEGGGKDAQIARGAAEMQVICDREEGGELIAVHSTNYCDSLYNHQRIERGPPAA